MLKNEALQFPEFIFGPCEFLIEESNSENFIWLT